LFSSKCKWKVHHPSLPVLILPPWNEIKDTDFEQDNYFKKQKIYYTPGETFDDLKARIVKSFGQ